jgi:hypothetical protein
MTDYVDDLIALLDNNPDAKISDIIDNLPKDEYPKTRYKYSDYRRNQHAAWKKQDQAKHPAKYKVLTQRKRAYNRIQVICECGVSAQRNHLERHRTTTLHRRRMCWN